MSALDEAERLQKELVIQADAVAAIIRNQEGKIRVVTNLRGAGLPAIRLHDLRHSYATAALAAGIPAKVVSERLGHATIAITMDTYSHVLPGLDERAAATVARLILEGHESEPSGSIDKPLTTGRVVPSTLDSAKGGEARNARSDG